MLLLQQIWRHSESRWDFKSDNGVVGRSTYDPHWKPINYKTWDGILYAHDFNGQ